MARRCASRSTVVRKFRALAAPDGCRDPGQEGAARPRDQVAQRVEAADLVPGEALGQAAQRAALGFDQGVGAEPLDHRDAGDDDLPPAHPLDRGRGERPTVGHVHRRRSQRVGELGAEVPGERAEAVEALDRRGMQVAGRGPHRVRAERRLVDAELPADEGHHPLGDDLAAMQEPPRVAQGAELEREAEPVGLPAPAPDGPEVLVAQRVMAGELGLIVGRRREERLPLGGGCGRRGAAWGHSGAVDRPGNT